LAQCAPDLPDGQLATAMFGGISYRRSLEIGDHIITKKFTIQSSNRLDASKYQNGEMERYLYFRPAISSRRAFWRLRVELAVRNDC
jgi:hypothetical protein